MPTEQSTEENIKKLEPISGDNNGGRETDDRQEATELLSVGQEELTVDPDGKSTYDSVYDDEYSVDQRKVTELLYGEAKGSMKSNYIVDLIEESEEAPVPETVETEESEEADYAVNGEVGR